MSMNNLFLPMEPKAVPNEEEYLGKDGITFCRKCHTPTRQRILHRYSEELQPILCRCKREELERIEQKLAELERMNTLAQLKSKGISDKSFLSWRFASAQDSATIRVAKRYTDKWTQVRERNLGLLFWGDVGTGKSFAAACIANALLERGIPVLMTNFSKILNQMGGMYSKERNRFIADLNDFELLIIDDLGIERDTEYALEQVYAIIDERYKSCKPLIVTTNLTIGEILDPMDVAHARIYSRLLELCTPVQVKGLDHRTEISRDKQALARELLGEAKEVVPMVAAD